MAIYRIIERCGWWPQGIKEWVEKTFPGAKILDWEDKTFQCEGYYGYSRSGHREVIFECSENIIPGAYRPGCEFHWSAHHMPAHWCEYFKPGKLNLHYPAPLPACPKLPAGPHAESAKLEEFV